VTTTADRILDSAQTLVQVRGYNGFSYADISAELSITKPSIHHHFPTKAALAEALIARYRERFAVARKGDQQRVLRGRDAGVREVRVVQPRDRASRASKRAGDTEVSDRARRHGYDAAQSV